MLGGHQEHIALPIQRERSDSQRDHTDRHGTLCTDRDFSIVMSLLSADRLAATVSAMHVTLRLLPYVCILSNGTQRARRASQAACCGRKAPSILLADGPVGPLQLRRSYKFKKSI